MAHFSIAVDNRRRFRDQGPTWTRRHQHHSEHLRPGQRAEPRVQDAGGVRRVAADNHSARHLQETRVPPAPSESACKLAISGGGGNRTRERFPPTRSRSPRSSSVSFVGQVLRYRQLLRDASRSVVAMIAVEKEPADTTWTTLCSEMNLVLVWPETMRTTLRSLGGRATRLTSVQAGLTLLPGWQRKASRRREDSSSRAEPGPAVTKAWCNSRR
jgi:hypothetical protein